MIENNLIALIPSVGEASVAGREFFCGDLPSETKKEFIEKLLIDGEFEHICEVMHCCHISDCGGSTDYLSADKPNESLEARYFDLFLSILDEYKIDISLAMPLVFATADAARGTILREWVGAAYAYLLKSAYADYDKAAEYFYKFDTKFLFTSILIKVDRYKTIAALTNMAIFGKNIDKTALRKFLRDYKSDVVAQLRPIYGSLMSPERLAAIRLLLLYKNDVTASGYLSELAVSEKSKVIRRAIEKDCRAKEKKVSGTECLKYFYDAMVSGESMPLLEFNDIISSPDSARIASELFFSAYKNGRIQEIIIVDDGKILNLENKPITLEDDCEVRVLHPIEVSAKYSYLRQLNITQPFAQIKRTVYTPSENDINYSVCERLAGTLVSAVTLRANMKKYGYKILNKNIDGESSGAGLARNGIMCVLEFSPTNFAEAESRLVTIANIKFYSYADIIKLNNQMYVDGVPLYPIKNIAPRAFSEFMFSIYELLEC